MRCTPFAHHYFKKTLFYAIFNPLCLVTSTINTLDNHISRVFYFFEKILNMPVNDNRTLLQKVHDFFKQFAEKLKEIKQKLSKSSVVYSEVNHDIDFLEQLAEKNKTMLDSVKGTASKQSDTVKHSRNTVFSYDKLIKKPDMNITQIDDSTHYKADTQTRKGVINLAIENAKKVEKVNENGNPAIYVDDIEKEVVVPKRAIKQALDRRLRINAPVVINAGSILKKFN